MSIAQKHGKSVAQVILRWLIQRCIVAIPKSVRKERIAENFQIFDFQLDGDDLQDIVGLETGKSAIFDHRDPKMAKWLGAAQRNT
ncbi:putative oxidoreductase [Planctomyces sp. SH-PL14]|nr:aldo/keto reductase [Planctomyces sp. SH-PL14]AMV18036.1 putative oxidoreductase [Planctomyces sp. SH-PL14]